MISLYKKYFPNMVFINPSNITFNNDNNDNIINCPESSRGFYEYMCFRKIYNKNSNMKGYLIINDDNFMRTWEIENYDFNIPWINEYKMSFWKTFLYNRRKSLKIDRKHFYNLNIIISNNSEWKQNITNFFGSYGIPKGLVDNIYFPNTMFKKFLNIVEQMYNHKRKILLEMAIPSALGIINLPKYQLLNILGLGGLDRLNIIKYLKSNFNATFLHPIKFSQKKLYWKEVSTYIYFINAEEF